MSLTYAQRGGRPPPTTAQVQKVRKHALIKI